jgi:chromate transport protein ChrA
VIEESDTAKLTAADTVPTPAFGEAVRVWLKIGLISFGGPAAQIAILHEELGSVDEVDSQIT